MRLPYQMCSYLLFSPTEADEKISDKLGALRVASLNCKQCFRENYHVPSTHNSYAPKPTNSNGRIECQNKEQNHKYRISKNLLQLKDSKEVKITATVHFKIPIKNIKTCVMGRLSLNDTNWHGGYGPLAAHMDTAFFSVFESSEFLD